MSTISVIIPIYNTERYLDRCLKSVCSQDYRDLNIVLIDDGSSDGSSTICDTWAEKDSRIDVVHKTHGSGVAAARNTGLEHMRGDYVAWIDSDDWVEPDYLSSLMNAMHIADADFGVAIPNRDSKIPVEIRRGAEQILKEQLQGFRPVLLNTLIKAELYTGIRFRDFRIGEDTALLTEIACKSSVEVLVGSRGYHHLYRDDSVSHEQDIDSMRSWLKSVQWRNAYIQKNYPHLYRYVHYDSIENGARILRQLRTYPQNEQVYDVRGECRALIRRSLFRVPVGAIRYDAGRFTEWMSAAKNCLLR